MAMTREPPMPLLLRMFTIITFKSTPAAFADWLHCSTSWHRARPNVRVAGRGLGGAARKGSVEQKRKSPERSRSFSGQGDFRDWIVHAFPCRTSDFDIHAPRLPGWKPPASGLRIQTNESTLNRRAGRTLFGELRGTGLEISLSELWWGTRWILRRREE